MVWLWLTGEVRIYLGIGQAPTAAALLPRYWE